MSIVEIFVISLGLAADAFAAALVRGLNMRRVSVMSAVASASVFGGFQGVMPLFGYLAGGMLSAYVARWDNYVAAALLAAIGADMIKNSFDTEAEVQGGTASLFAVGFATSVDACAVGVTFAINGVVRIFPACAVIALTTFILSLVGVMLGSKLGERYNRHAERAGGAVLIGMGLKLLLQM
jgi:putative Mn2+ efflux pump MntP